MLKLLMLSADKKLDVIVFVPTHQCTCNYTHFIDGVFKAILPIRKFVQMDTKDIHCPLAESLNLRRYSIVIFNPPSQKNPLIFTDVVRFKMYIHSLKLSP